MRFFVIYFSVLWYPDPESFVEDKVILVDSGSIQEYKIDGTSATVGLILFILGTFQVSV